jgi:SAM-dependent methyltransferase
MRYLADGYPDLEAMGVAYYTAHQERSSRVPEILTCIEGLINTSVGLRTACVVGCGPNPHSVQEMAARGYATVGVEPVPGSAEAAAAALGQAATVLVGSAERVPLPDGSQRIVLYESVLEHVDSPSGALAEAYRILCGDGVAFIRTTNRHRLSLTGQDQEYNVRFYNWFPGLVKECYVFRHLHYDPRLANYTPRPAVHWFTYADLCRLGRNAGFSRFYSPLDCGWVSATGKKRLVFNRWMLDAIRRYPWLRALALTQLGDSIFMVKTRARAS